LTTKKDIQNQLRKKSRFNTETLSTYTKNIMTFAQQLKQQGLQEGLQQGLEKGRHLEAIAIAKNMLAKRFDHKIIKEITGLSDQDLLNLED
jgi:predicted transposase/invertase (TIGR01784 family)